MGVLYTVALPIGNLDDVSLRALEVLKKADCIACEDTRNTQILLNKYQINTKLIDCHKFNEKQRSSKISEILENNGTVALVSDAGTPNICDPGSVLIKELVKSGHKVIAIPGACALTAFLSAVPRENEFFTFVGFLPKTNSQKKELFEKFSFINCVFYDSPNRFSDTLNLISELFGSDRQIAVGRELTKIHEEIISGSVGEISEYYEKNTLKGEIVAMVFGQNDENCDEAVIKKDIQILKKQGFSDKDISKILSSVKNYPKNQVYQLAVNLK
ncbi:MAG: 16S rRNA (cytidine(1402)-2'-O)-methyltransferase [Candidatus Gastranaerophilales bacterium]|nr:16S rRNA (cytidine(1402)-2'-O)-methyltransferase [Candidatus Gastranaerophilales bacterium]